MKKIKVVTLFLFAFIMFFSTFPVYSFAATNWQAYFFTSWTDITDQDLEYLSQAWIYPNDIRDSAHFNTAVSFKK